MTDADPGALAGWLAGNFSDADLAGLTDDQAAVEGLDTDTADWYRQVLSEGRAALADEAFAWQRIGKLANRRFADEAQARSWLAARLVNLADRLGEP